MRIKIFNKKMKRIVNMKIMKDKMNNVNGNGHLH